MLPTVIRSNSNSNQHTIVKSLLVLALNLRSYLSWAKHGFLICLLCIVGVSIYDSYMVVLNCDILIDERNPICALLIKQDPNGFSWFLWGKFLGNVGVISSLAFLRWVSYSRAKTITYSVVGFQFGLLIYLTLSDSQSGFLHFDGLFSQNPQRFYEGLAMLGIHVAGLATIFVFWFAARISWSALQRKRKLYAIEVAS